ncbi:MAG TPA: hypothetical protein VK986_24340, partial [Tepidisphaeraceae bacterium]|nr:hypothetical protein [Tepidisphaeraceae bacterium]
MIAATAERSSRTRTGSAGHGHHRALVLWGGGAVVAVVFFAWLFWGRGGGAEGVSAAAADVARMERKKDGAGLQSLITGGDTERATLAAGALARATGPGAVPALQAALGDARPDVR